jgi:hypothetical protein
MKTHKKKSVQYIPGAAGEGLWFFPAVTCQIAGHGAPRTRWVVHHRRRLFQTKQEALASAKAELALAFEDPELASSPERLLDHLRQRGFSELLDYRLARSFDEDHRSALGDESRPAFGDAAARHDPVLDAAVLQMVDNQIAGNDPPETRETFERLVAEGYSPEHARRMIGFLLALGLTETLVRRRQFDVKGYVESLRRLPEIPRL